MFCAAIVLIAFVRHSSAEDWDSAARAGREHYAKGDYALAAESLELALTIQARAKASQASRMELLTALAMAQASAGWATSAESTLKVAAAIAGSSHGLQSEQCARLLIAQAAQSLSMGRDKDSEELLWQVFERGVANFTPITRSQFLCALAGVAAARRWYAVTEKLIRGAQGEFDENNIPNDAKDAYGSVLALKAGLEAQVGSPEAALRLFGQMDDFYQAAGASQRAAHLLLVESWVDLLIRLGRLDEAEAIANRSPFRQPARTSKNGDSGDCRIALIKAKLAAARGNGKVAEEYLAQATRVAPPANDRSAELSIRLSVVAADVRLCTGDISTSMSELSRAIDLMSKSSSHPGLDAADQLWKLATMEHGCGRLTEACRDAARSLAIRLRLLDAEDVRVRGIVDTVRSWALSETEGDATVSEFRLCGGRVGQNIEPDSKRIDREHTDALTQGTASLRNGDLEEALSSLDRAVQLRGGEAVARHRRARCLEGLREYDRAYVDAVASVTLDPLDASHHLLLAAIQMRCRRFAAAAHAAHWARWIDPGKIEALIFLAFARIGGGEYELAVRWFESAARTRPLSPQHTVTFARCLMALGKLDEAETQYRSALDRAPDRVFESATIGLAETNRRAGRLAAALELCEAVVGRVPGSVDGHILGATLVWESGEAGLALERIRNFQNSDGARSDAQVLLTRWLLEWEVSKSGSAATIRQAAVAPAGDARNGTDWDLLKFITAGKTPTGEERASLFSRAALRGVDAECRARLFVGLLLERAGQVAEGRELLRVLVADPRFRGSSDHTTASGWLHRNAESSKEKERGG